MEDEDIFEKLEFLTHHLDALTERGDYYEFLQKEFHQTNRNLLNKFSPSIKYFIAPEDGIYIIKFIVIEEMEEKIFILTTKMQSGEKMELPEDAFFQSATLIG